MNQAQYLALLKLSTTFRDFSADLKRTILKATGEQREKYAQIFLEEMTSRKLAAKNYVNRNEQILVNCNYKSKKQKVKSMLKDESVLSTDELNSAEELIKNL